MQKIYIYNCKNELMTRLKNQTTKIKETFIIHNNCYTDGMYHNILS